MSDRETISYECKKARCLPAHAFRDTVTMSYWKPEHPLQNGRYAIDKVLGTGGAGITYRAKDRATGHLVAIKTLNVILQSQPDFSKHQERFIQEAFLLARCNHKHIIRVGDVFQEGGVWCMVMEYIAGGNLRQYVNHRGILPENEALRYIKQVGEALAYIHQQGFLHRDVKPANIMLRPKTLEAVLIDFGLARDFVQDRTQVHTNSRTESFAPIEQYELRAKRGAYTDVYALAATLYYILTLQLPFPAPILQQGISLIPPKHHNPQISDRVNNAILLGMIFEPDKRPQSVPAWLELFRSSASVVLPPPKQSPSPPYGAVQSPQMQTSPRQPSSIAVLSETQHPPLDREEELVSAVGIDYHPLQNLLKAGKWQEADRETARIMLEVAGREKQGWLDSIHIDNFPCQDFQTLDRLWLENSNGHFGFSVQKSIYESLGGKKDYNAEVWRNFSEKVGWRKNGHWLSYKDLNFNLTASEGHLPMLGMHLWGFTGWISVVASRLQACKM